MSALAVILEDDPMRVQRMRAALKQMRPEADVAAFDAVPPFIEFVRSEASHIVLITLDHDLTRDGCTYTAEERGDGVSACVFLKSMQPICPVIVHSSNYGGASVMIEELRAAGWRTIVVTPFSEIEYGWIEDAW